VVAADGWRHRAWTSERHLIPHGGRGRGSWLEDEAAPDRGFVAQGGAIAEGEEGGSTMAYGCLRETPSGREIFVAFFSPGGGDRIGRRGERASVRCWAGLAASVRAEVRGGA
jgi:hypothetical protein